MIEGAGRGNLGPAFECPEHRGDNEIVVGFDVALVAEPDEHCRGTGLTQNRQPHGLRCPGRPARCGREFVHDGLGKLTPAERLEAINAEVRDLDSSVLAHGDAHVEVGSERVRCGRLCGPVAAGQEHVDVGVLEDRTDSSDEGRGHGTGVTADGDAQLAERTNRSSKALAFPHCGQRRRTPAALQATESGDGVVATDRVAHESGIALELCDRVLSERTEDAIDPSGVEAERAEPQLQFGDVVASHHRRAQAQQPPAELESRFDQRRPGLDVTDTVRHESALRLEGLDAGGGRLAVVAPRILSRVAACDQPALQVLDRRTA